MPLYEYECAACGAKFEHLIRSQREERAAACPECGSKKIARQLSVFAAHNAPSAPSTPPAGGCGRCGDPYGPCALSE